MGDEATKKKDEQTDVSSTVTGFIVIFLFIVGAFFAIPNIWQFFFPTGSLVLSAYPQKSGDASILYVTGKVLVKGKPVEDGTVKLTIERVTQGSSETVLLNLINGEFKTTETAFQLDPEERIRVNAEAWYPGISGSVKDEVFIGKAPVIPSIFGYGILIGFCALLVFLFLWSFTGPQSEQKNRVAIILSYIVIGLFLAIPLVAPILLAQLFPEFLDQMKRAPVGLIVAKADDSTTPSAQWVLNIGGSAVPTFTPISGTSTEATTSTGAKAAPSAPQAENSTPNDSRRLQNRAVGLQTPAPMEVSGGLIVPLYVIVLSVIGGAINMTRRVPEYQARADVSLVETFESIRTVGRFGSMVTEKVQQVGRLASRVGSEVPKPKSTGGQDNVAAGSVSNLTQSEKTIEPTEELGSECDVPRPLETKEKKLQSVGVDPKSETGKGQQTQTTIETPRKGEEFEQNPDEAEKVEDYNAKEYHQWRKGLLSQYMYLISAPFLAIATYYLCIWLAFKVVPLFVLVSFSVGLISDQIINAITELVRGVLRSDNSKQPSPG